MWMGGGNARGCGNILFASYNDFMPAGLHWKAQLTSKCTAALCASLIMRACCQPGFWSVQLFCVCFFSHAHMHRPRVQVDQSVVETFAQGGRTCISTRAYPLHQRADNVYLMNGGQSDIEVASVDVWIMNPARFSSP